MFPDGPSDVMKPARFRSWLLKKGLCVGAAVALLTLVTMTISISPLFVRYVYGDNPFEPAFWTARNNYLEAFQYVRRLHDGLLVLAAVAQF